MTQKDLITFYNTVFLPVYADTVAFLADKPAQIIIELENTFAHQMKYLDTNNTKEIREDNLTKAYNHLVRATIDCYKLLWVEMSEEIELFMGDDKTRKFTVNMKENEAVTLWVEFRENAQKARREELNGIGKTPLDTINLYSDTVEIGWKILKECDREKMKALQKFNLKNFLIQQWIGLVVGIVGGLLTAGILAFLS